jgi:paraquat-inducible protein A
MSEHVMACHECDLLQRIPEAGPGTQVRCRRCGHLLARPRSDSIDTTIALLLAAVVLFAILNSFPFLAFKKEGLVQNSHLVTGIMQLFRQGMWEVALLVAVNTIIAPGLQLALFLYILLPLHFGRQAPGMFRAFRYLRLLQPWGMIEVFMLGVLVSIVKLGKMAQIIPGAAAWSLMGLMFVLAAATAALDPHEVWDRWEGTP